MENRFNDFSRFKNNQLRSYFRQKEYEYNKSNLKNPFLSSILSGLAIAFLWSARDNYSHLIESFWLKVLFYPIIILIVYLTIYFIFFYFIDKICHLISKFLNTIKVGQKLKKDKYYLDKFKFEVVNQVSLALSIISHKNDQLENFNETEKEIVELENRFYTVEAFYHLSDALEILQTEILDTPFKKKIFDNDYKKINQIRVKELVDLSSSLYKKFVLFWTKQKVKNSYSKELNELGTTILSIKKVLKEQK